MTDDDRWARYRAARNAPPTHEPKPPAFPARDRPSNLRRKRIEDAVWVADEVGWFGWFAYGIVRLIVGAVSGGTGLAAIWADGLAAKVLLGAIAVGIAVIFYIARDASDEPRTTGEWAPPRDDRSKRRR